MALTDRQRVLAVVFLGVSLVTLVILWQVLQTVFFSITVAYVLYPVRRKLVDRDTSHRIAAAVATTVGFVFVVLLITPIVFSLYVRQDQILQFIRAVPGEQTVTVFGMSHTIDGTVVLDQVQDAVVSVAVDIARASPVIALNAFLFVFLVYALLLRPENVRRATFRVLPSEYHDVALALHRQVRDTLYALYVLQAATSFGTFVVALIVFWSLGYDSYFTLAVFSGLLQFIPVIGPSILIVVLAALEAVAGQITDAVIVGVVGLLLIGFLPDATIRPRLASLTTGMPASLYFVGFTGGTLTIGVMGVIAGPLVIAVLGEVVNLLTGKRASVQQTFQEDSLSTTDDGSGVNDESVD